MKLVNLSIAAAAACLFATSAHALKSEDRVVKGNMTVEYTKVPGSVDSFSEMFSEAEVYGRLRANSFWWDWSDNTKNNDSNMLGIGGSIVYKTGYWNGFGATVGFYGALPLHDDNLNGTTNYGKSGKDTYHQRKDGTEGGMGNFAEAYLEYKSGKTSLKIGRQGIDSKMLATNDTKMIPNTFEAAVIESKSVLPDTTLRAGYIVSQKLRDHQNFHSVIAYDKINENDDSGAHKGLTLAKIAAAGEDANPEMVLVTASNKSIPNLKLDAEYVGVNGFVSTAIAEANYQIKINDGWSLTPGVRYLNQMDDGAGAIGGSALKGGVIDSNASANGYTVGNNVDSSIIMGRLVLEGGALKVTAGYSKIADKADIIAPWRGFPTGGYTRTMAQVDWLANTKNSTLRVDYDFGKAGIIPGFKAAVAYEDINQDEAKGYSDRTVKQFDFWKTFASLPNTEFRFRVGLQDSKKPVDNESYDEYRIEMNYLF